MRIFEKAYAKLNLYLDVTGREADGFHSLRSVMQTVALADGVLIEASPASVPSVTISVRGKYRVPVGEGNLCHRALMQYMSEAAIPMRIHVYLHKRIPVAAGLGGGSADAAAALRAVNRAAGNRFSVPRLLALAAKLGSDVPFCLLGHTRLCEGRGERMLPLPTLRGLPLVLVPSAERVSTPEAYALLDKAYGDFADPCEHGSLSAVTAALSAGDTQALLPSLYNIFEDVILPVRPGALQNRASLRSLGAAATLMSGSGPTVVGFFETEEAAAVAAKKLGKGAVATHTV